MELIDVCLASRASSHDVAEEAPPPEPPVVYQVRPSLQCVPEEPKPVVPRVRVTLADRARHVSVYNLRTSQENERVVLKRVCLMTWRA